MSATEYRVHLNISADEFERVYRGSARNILATDEQRRRIQFPASALRPFVTHEGVRGVFVIRVDTCNKLIDVQRALQ